MEADKKAYEYPEIIEELTQNQAIDPEMVYHYDTNRRLFRAYNDFFKFCQENLSEVCVRDGYGIEPTRFYYHNKDVVNAGAWPKRNGYYCITINSRTLEDLWDIFGTLKVLDNPAISDYKKLNEFYEQAPTNISIVYLMFQSTLQFIYYHELSHIIQKHNLEVLIKGSGGQENLTVEELYWTLGQQEFSLTKHVLEYDSDIHGAQEMGNRVYDFWKRLDANDQTGENLGKLMVISLVGVVGFYLMLLDAPDPNSEDTSHEGLYFYEWSHPHPIIRLQWIILSMIDRIQENLPSIHVGDVMGETLRVLDVFLAYRGVGSIRERYAKPLFENRANIISYIKTIMKESETPQYRFLTINTIHKGIRL